MIQPILIILHPNEYSQELHYYLFAVKLDRCVGNSNTLNDSSNKLCFPNNTKDSNLSVLKMITGVNESKTLTKHRSCESKCKFDGGKCNSDQWWENDKCWCECKRPHVCEKDYVPNLATCICKNGKYSASIVNNSAIMCDEIIESYDEETKTI